jgi:Family of unknown function (DUF5941)
MTVAEAVHALDGRVVSWVRRRSLAPNSSAGISLALGLCAATWFSAGTRAGDVNGALALCGCYLAGRAARAGSSAQVCAAAAECAVYAGLAADAAAAGWSGSWKLAAVVIILTAVRQTLGACGGAAEPETGDRGLVSRAAEAVLTLPVGAQVLLIILAAPALGPHAALSGLLAWSIAALGYVIAGHRGNRTPASERAAPGRLAMLAAYRDDGAFARFAGRIVRGQLVPLPPALAGLSAAVMLAVLGLAHLPGIIALSPLAVMLLAAPGSSHPHDGRLDWMVPAVLQAGQYVYIATLGFTARVPGPVVIALCAAIAIRSVDLAYQAGSAPSAAAGTAAETGRGMGWEGRMLAAGLGVILGIPTFAYLALTVYLGVLIGRDILARSLAAGAGDRR